MCETYIQHVGFIWKNCTRPINFLYILVYIFIMFVMGGVVDFD